MLYNIYISLLLFNGTFFFFEMHVVFGILSLLDGLHHMFRCLYVLYIHIKYMYYITYVYQVSFSMGLQFFFELHMAFGAGAVYGCAASCHVCRCLYIIHNNSSYVYIILYTYNGS